MDHHTICTIYNCDMTHQFDESMFWMFLSFLLQNSKRIYASPVKFFSNTVQERVAAKMQFIPLQGHSEMQCLSTKNFTKVCASHSRCYKAVYLLLGWTVLQF